MEMYSDTALEHVDGHLAPDDQHYDDRCCYGSLVADRDEDPSTDYESSARQDEFERAQRIASGKAQTGDLQWLSKGFASFLAGSGAIPLERCLRLPRNSAAYRRTLRNYWLRRAWEAVDSELSPWRRSESLAAAVRDFECRFRGRWSMFGDLPDTSTELESALLHAFRSHDRIPYTAMQLHNITCGRD